MKKQFILGLALCVSLLSFAQKKELKSLEKAVKNNNYAEAKAFATQLESMVATMDDKSKAKYYLNTAKAYFANGAGSNTDIMKAVESVENTMGSAYASDAEDLKKLMEADLLAKANTAYSGLKFKVAAAGFTSLYSMKPTDQDYLFFAASSAFRADDLDLALTHYLKLRELGYEGITTKYYAVNKETGEVEDVFSKENSMSLVNRLKTHITPTEKKTESRARGISEQIIYIYTKQEKYKEALKAAQTARTAFPDYSGFILSEANAQYKLGNKEEYKRLVSLALEKDPTNADLYFNLGLVSSESGDLKAAKAYYAKAIGIRSEYPEARLNIGALLLDESKMIGDEMNALGNSSADNRKYEELRGEQLVLYKESIPHFEMLVRLDPNRIDVLRTLKSIFEITEDDAKIKEVKQKIAALEKGN